jgi:predicted RNase H-like nuclease (RuvC/YqgF family)
MRPSALPTIPPGFAREESGASSSNWYGSANDASNNHVDAQDALKRENLALKVEIVTLSNFVEQFQKQNVANASSFTRMQKQLQDFSGQTAKIAELEKSVEILNKQDKTQKVWIEKLHHELGTTGMLGSNSNWKAAV